MGPWAAGSQSWFVVRADAGTVAPHARGSHVARRRGCASFGAPGLLPAAPARLEFAAMSVPNDRLAGESVRHSAVWWLDAVRREERRGELLSAFDLAERGLTQHPTDLALKHRAVLALARTGATDEAARRLKAYGLAGSSDEEVSALPARSRRTVRWPARDTNAVGELVPRPSCTAPSSRAPVATVRRSTPPRYGWWLGIVLARAGWPRRSWMSSRPPMIGRIGSPRQGRGHATRREIDAQPACCRARDTRSARTSGRR
jgi:hypothetical protein